MTSFRKGYSKQRRVQPRNIRWEPEHHLVAAMLQQAIWDRHWRWYWNDAKKWVAAMSEEPFGFAWCCRQVDQDPVAVRDAIVAQWHEAAATQPAKGHGRRQHKFSHLHSGSGPARPLTTPL